jgi:hypothetical protein
MSAPDGVGGQCPAPVAVLSGRTRHPHVGRWVGPRAGLDGCGKSRPNRDSITGPSSPLPVAYRLSYSGPTISNGIDTKLIRKYIPLTELIHIKFINFAIAFDYTSRWMWTISEFVTGLLRVSNGTGRQTCSIRQLQNFYAFEIVRVCEGNTFYDWFGMYLWLIWHTFYDWFGIHFMIDLLLYNYGM